MNIAKIVQVERNTDFGSPGNLIVGLDSPKSGQILNGDEVSISGWILSKENVPAVLEIKDENGERRLEMNVDRADVTNNNTTHFPRKGGAYCGFRHFMPVKGKVEVSIISGDRSYPFFQMDSTPLASLDIKALCNATVDAFIAAKGGPRPENSHADNTKEAAIIEEVWSIAEVCHTKRPNPDLISRLTQFRRHHGVAAVAMLKESLNRKILYPQDHELTHHGAMRTFRFWSDTEIDTHLDDVHGFLSKLNAVNYPSFIFFGTLLGVIRDNQLIPHDDDIDTVCILPAMADATIPDYTQRMADILKEAGGRVVGNYPHHRHVSLGRRAFDVFLGVDYGETVTLYSYKTVTCPRSEIFPMDELEFRGKTYQAPASSEKAIARYYGPEWRTPDKNFYDK